MNHWGSPNELKNSSICWSKIVCQRPHTTWWLNRRTPEVWPVRRCGRLWNYPLTPHPPLENNYHYKRAVALTWLRTMFRTFGCLWIWSLVKHVRVSLQIPGNTKEKNSFSFAWWVTLTAFGRSDQPVLRGWPFQSIISSYKFSPTGAQAACYYIQYSR